MQCTFCGSSGKNVEPALPVDVSEDGLELSCDEGNELQANLQGESESEDYEPESEDEDSEGEIAVTGITSVR